MSKGWRYDKGNWWVICDVCAQKTAADKIKKRWDGLLVCPADFEYRHPQDFVKAQTDRITVPFSRPRPTDVYVPVNYVSYPTDQVVFDEVLSKDCYIVIPDSVEYTGDTGNQSLGSQYLGEMSLAGNSTIKGYNSRIGFTESITISQGYNVTASDSIGFSETFVKQDDEVSGADTMSFSEVVAVSTFVNKALGVQVLGSITLG